MTLEEILEDIDVLVPNSLSNKKKIRWINQVQRQLFRDYPVPEALAEFDTVVGQHLYDLPTNCVESKINHISVNDVDYEYKGADEEAGENEKFWTTVKGMLFINPTPKTINSIVIRYIPRPTDLTEVDLSVIPEFPEDYHELLVLGCAEKTALTNEETRNLAETFKHDFFILAKKADRDLRKYRSKRVTIMRGWF